MKTKAIKITDENIEVNIKRYRRLVVDCWAEWCAPCRRIAPIVDELVEFYGGDVAFGKLDIDGNRNTVKKYEIMSIPTFLVFKHGDFVGQIVGGMPRHILESEISKRLF